MKEKATQKQERTTDKKVTKKKSTKKLTQKDMMEALRKYVKRELLDQYAGHLHTSISKGFKTVCENMKNMEKRNQDSQLEIKKLLTQGKQVYIDLESKVESLEESFLLVMHNIKKNQFLYSHYPEEWVKDYLSIKEGLKHENNFMDKKIACGGSHD